MTGTPAAAVTMPEAANPALLPLPTHRTRNGLANRDRSLVLGAIDTAPEPPAPPSTSACPSGS